MSKLKKANFIIIFLAYKLFSLGVDFLLRYFGINLEWNRILSWTFLFDLLLSGVLLFFVALSVLMFSEKRNISIMLLCFIMIISFLGVAAHFEMI